MLLTLTNINLTTAFVFIFQGYVCAPKLIFRLLTYRLVFL